MKDLWETILAQIELSISPANFATWFKNTKVISQEKDEIVVSVPNSFVREWLENKYKKNILKILRSLNTRTKKIEFTVNNKKATKTKNISLPSNISQEIEQMRLEVFTKNRRTGLNPSYTFENFIVGGFNELAHAAATAVSEKPGLLYNPLFLYGKVGLGKTHLLQAVGNKIIDILSDKKARYIPSERFVSDIITSIRNGTIESLKREYRQIDILIIDDVQFLAGKEKTQEEFFHIFNALYQKNKQIILSSDRSPKAIPALTKRLRSRFEGGMIADIGFPELETRIAILKTKAQERNAELSLETYNFLAENIKTNIRELEGALNRIILYQKVRNKKVSLDKIKELVRDFIVVPQKKLSFQKIIKTVAEFYDVNENDLLSSSRKKEIVRPRQIAMYLIRKKLKNSYPSIAQRLGGKDHTTVIYACRKITKQLSENEGLKKDIDLINMRFINS